MTFKEVLAHVIDWLQQDCAIVEEWITLRKQDGKALPPPTIGKNVAEKLLETAS